MRAHLKFDEVHQKYRAPITKYLARMVGNSDVDDLTQIVFDKVNRSLSSLEDERKIPVWIYKTATHAALDWIRQRASRKVDSTICFEDVERAIPAPGVRLPEHALIRHEMKHCIRELVDELPEKHRAILVLSELEELSQSEIAEVLGVTISDIKTSLHRARAKLKKLMESNCDLYQDEDSGLSCDRKSCKQK